MPAAGTTLGCCVAALAATALAQRPAPVPPSQGAVATGKWRNMFVEAGYKQSEIDAKLNSTFTQLFYGDPKTQSIYTEVPAEDTAYVSDVSLHQARAAGCVTLRRRRDARPTDPSCPAPAPAPRLSDQERGRAHGGDGLRDDGVRPDGLPEAV